MRWLAEVHLGYDGIEDPDDAGGEHFYTGNVSAKTEFLRGAGGFDEHFSAIAHDDIDLGLRLEQRGLRLVYDRTAVVDHYQPTDLPTTVERMLRVGASLVSLVERHPARMVARRPGLRHRTKAGALTALAALEARTPRLQRETWRFLCHEAAREGYWTTYDARGANGVPPPAKLRIGARLARLASRDPDAQMPPDGLPAAHDARAVGVVDS
jgi:hypothetical protein